MRIARIKETCIYVTDLQRTRIFYEKSLGLATITFVPDRHVFFEAGESVLLCFIAAQTEKEAVLPPHGARGSIHFALEIGKEDYGALREDLRKKGIVILHEHEWKGGLLSFYFHDPDNNLVEVIQEGVWDRH